MKINVKLMIYRIFIIYANLVLNSQRAAKNLDEFSEQSFGVVSAGWGSNDFAD